MVDIYHLTIPGNNRDHRNKEAINNKLPELIGYEGQLLNSAMGTMSGIVGDDRRAADLGGSSPMETPRKNPAMMRDGSPDPGPTVMAVQDLHISWHHSCRQNHSCQL